MISAGAGCTGGPRIPIPSMVRLYIILAVLAASPLTQAHAEQRPLWELGIGVAPLYSPDYRGSDQSRAYFLPLPYVVYNGEIIRIDRRGLYSRLIETDRVNLDLSFDGGVPVDSSKNDARRGMADLDPVFEVGPSLEICVWNHCSSDVVVQFRLPVRAVFSTDFSTFESRGGTAQPNFNLDVKNFGPDRSWRFSASFGPLYATERFHDYYYQVTAVDATPVRPVYDARAGYSGSRIMLTFSKRHRQLWIGGFARYDDLHGAVFEGSPLVRVHHSFMAGVGIAWILAESKEMVEVRD
jgi:outer membrane scaffolding protein for murein synthesis (MipA/OmpV family)